MAPLILCPALLCSGNFARRTFVFFRDTNRDRTQILQQLRAKVMAVKLIFVANYSHSVKVLSFMHYEENFKL